MGPGVSISMHSAGGGGVASPVSILGSGVQVWLRADLGITVATGVSTWADQSGNGNDFTQATAGAQPAFQATGGPNSTPSVLFDGSDDYLESAGPNLDAPGTTPVYIWIIGRQKTWTNGERLLTQTGAASIVLYQNATTPRFDRFNGGTSQANTAWTLDTFKRCEFLFSNAVGDYSNIGATSTTGNAGNTDPGAGFRLCRTNGVGTGCGHFEICELVIYQGTAPTSTQRTALDAYATARYGPL